MGEWIAAAGSGYSPMASCCMYGDELLGTTISTAFWDGICGVIRNMMAENEPEQKLRF
jgi:hypothetical protein